MKTRDSVDGPRSGDCTVVLRNAIVPKACLTQNANNSGISGSVMNVTNVVRLCV
jgi:hypothetical protein